MKSFLFLFFYVQIFISSTCSQTCPTVKVTSPTVSKPTESSLVSSTCNMLVVKWKGTTGQAYIVQGIRKDPLTNNTDTVNGTGISCDGTQSCTANIAVFAGAIVTWTVEAISVIDGQTLYSYAERGVLEFPVRSCNQSGVTFTGKVLLQGPYNTGTGMMTNTLNSLGILQSQASSQPYNVPGFNYTGTESVGAGFFASHPDIVDWVLLELRDANIPLSPVARRAAFVKQDGTLVETDGSNTLISFPGLATANYYVTILHRNHLGVRTAIALDFSSGAAGYDFTTSLSRAYDGGGIPTNNQMARLATAPNIYGMYSGNVNADRFTRKTGSASINDYSLLLSAVSSAAAPGPSNVYRSEDFNMDGNVRKTGSASTNDYSKLLSILGALNIITQPLF